MDMDALIHAVSQGGVSHPVHKDDPASLYMHVAMRWKAGSGFERTVQTLHNLVGFDLAFPASIPLAARYGELQGMPGIQAIMRRSKVATLQLVLDPFGTRLDDSRVHRLFLSGSAIAKETKLRRYDAPHPAPILEFITACRDALLPPGMGRGAYWYLRFARYACYSRKQGESIRCDYRLSYTPGLEEMLEGHASDFSAVQDAVAALVDRVARELPARTPVLTVIVAREGMMANFHHPV